MGVIVGDFRVDVIVTGSATARKASYTLTRLPGQGAGVSLIRRMLPETFVDIHEAWSAARQIGEAHARRWTVAYRQFLQAALPVY